MGSCQSHEAEHLGFQEWDPGSLDLGADPCFLGLADYEVEGVPSQSVSVYVNCTALAHPSATLFICLHGSIWGAQFSPRSTVLRTVTPKLQLASLLSLFEEVSSNDLSDIAPVMDSIRPCVSASLSAVHQPAKSLPHRPTSRPRTSKVAPSSVHLTNGQSHSGVTTPCSEPSALASSSSPRDPSIHGASEAALYEFRVRYDPSSATESPCAEPFTVVISLQRATARVTRSLSSYLLQRFSATFVNRPAPTNARKPSIVLSQCGGTVTTQYGTARSPRATAASPVRSHAPGGFTFGTKATAADDRDLASVLGGSHDGRRSYDGMSSVSEAGDLLSRRLSTSGSAFLHSIQMRRNSVATSVGMFGGPQRGLATAAPSGVTLATASGLIPQASSTGAVSKSADSLGARRAAGGVVSIPAPAVASAVAKNGTQSSLSEGGGTTVLGAVSVVEGQDGIPRFLLSSYDPRPPGYGPGEVISGKMDGDGDDAALEIPMFGVLRVLMDAAEKSVPNSLEQRQLLWCVDTIGSGQLLSAHPLAQAGLPDLNAQADADADTNELRAWVKGELTHHRAQDASQKGLSAMKKALLVSRLAASFLETSASANALSAVPPAAVEWATRQPAKVAASLGSLLNDFAFDVFAFGEHTHHQPLLSISLHLATEYSFYHHLSVDFSTLRNFFTLTEQHYLDNPYHRREHAADVVAATHYLLSACGFRGALTPLDEIVLIIAAAVHDVEHPGHNNTFERVTRSERALVYNDVSILENHSCAWAFQRMVGALDILKGLDTESREYVRSAIIAVVLATDPAGTFDLLGLVMSTYFTHVALPSSGQNVGDASLDAPPPATSQGSRAGSASKSDVRPSLRFVYDEQSREHRFLLMRLLIKLADVSNPLRPDSIAKEWSHRVMTEFFSQGDKERELGMTVSPFMDRTLSSIPQCQVGFIDFVVSPLVDALHRVQEGLLAKDLIAGRVVRSNSFTSAVDDLNSVADSAAATVNSSPSDAFAVLLKNMAQNRAYWADEKERAKVRLPLATS